MFKFFYVDFPGAGPSASAEYLSVTREAAAALLVKGYKVVAELRTGFRAFNAKAVAVAAAATPAPAVEEDDFLSVLLGGAL